MLTVQEAQSRIISAHRLKPPHNLPPEECIGRYTAAPLLAKRAQPPFSASAMDGYAVKFDDLRPGCRLKIIGESAAGHNSSEVLTNGTAIRIFTGATLPEGADTIVVQEDACTDEGYMVLTGEGPGIKGKHVRKAGLDFEAGQTLIGAGEKLDPRRLALAASAGYGRIPVAQRPRIALISTGDELVAPGVEPGPSQIVNSNSPMIGSLLRQQNCEVTDFGIIPDNRSALEAAFNQARSYDVVVTMGGASVGDHDLVQSSLLASGATINFWKIAMRPGKPMMFGELDQSLVIGLPGNPVSAFVCTHLFLLPLVRAMQAATHPLPRLARARLGVPLGENGTRMDFIRAFLSFDDSGLIAMPFSRQDSSMLSILAQADCLIERPMNAPPANIGDAITILPLNWD